MNNSDILVFVHRQLIKEVKLNTTKRTRKVKLRITPVCFKHRLLSNGWSCFVQVHHVVPFAVDGHQELLQLPHQEERTNLQHCESHTNIILLLNGYRDLGVITKTILNVSLFPMVLDGCQYYLIYSVMMHTF